MHAESAFQLTEENFEQEALNFPGVILVDVWATWCPPCIALTPVIEGLAKKYADNPNVRIAQLNYDEAEGVAANYSIMSIPTLMVFANGEQQANEVGLRPPPFLDKLIQDGLKTLKSPLTPVAA